MKRVCKALFIFSIILIFPVLVFAVQQTESRIITVTGDAEVRVLPDEVILSLGVETWNKQLNIAKKENDQRIKKIIGEAKKHKIEEKHIQTDYLGIEPRYESSYDHKKFIGYFVRKTLVLTLKDICVFENVLSDVLEAGANHVHGISFRTTKLRKFRDQARSLAINAAQEKANALAEELGQKIGKPYSIQENRSGWWSGYNSRWGSRWSGGMAQNTIQNIDSPSSSETDGAISLGQIKVNATVTVSFELK